MARMEFTVHSGDKLRAAVAVCAWWSEGWVWQQCGRGNFELKDDPRFESVSDAAMTDNLREITGRVTGNK